MEKNKLEKNLYDVLGQDIDVPNSFTNTISNFKYKKKKDIKMNIYKKVAVAFSFVIVSINLVTYGLMINENFKAESTVGYVDNSIQQAIEGGYIQNVEMDYLYSNDVGVKIDYVVMSDYNLNILFNFDISNKKIKQNVKADIDDLLIFDENNNIIYCYDYKIYKKFCKKNNIEYNEKKVMQYASGIGFQQIELTSDINKTLYLINTTKGFPKTEKLYIRFDTIYFDDERNNKIKGKWSFELNLKEEFYNREKIEYELETKSNDIELIEASITDTSMRITYRMKSININEFDNIYMYIKDDLGNEYYVNDIENLILFYQEKISVTFPICIRDDFKYLILYISINNKEYIPVILEPKN